MLEKLFYYLQGYLILELQGEEKERFLNLCKNREIEIIDIFLINNSWYCKIKSRDYKNFRALLKKTNCRTKINKKIGAPFMLRQLKKRKGLMIGTVFFLLIVTQCSERIWHIDVEGGFFHTREQILRVMKEELKVYGGVPGSTTDCFEIEKRLRLDYNEIGWISVEKRGCCLFVRMNESTMPKQVVKADTASHIVAQRDGIVKRVEVMAGVPKVKAGDRVNKGDILISGIVPVVGDFDELIRNQPVAAEGTVYLESEFSYQARHSMSYEQKKFTSDRSGLEIFLFGRKLFSYIPRYSDGKYDIISTDVVPYAFEDYQVPVLLRKYRCMKYDTEIIRMTEEEVKEKAQTEWERFLTDWEAQGVQIVSADFCPVIQRGVCAVTGTMTACGNFISYQEIMEEEWKIQDEYRGDYP